MAATREGARPATSHPLSDQIRGFFYDSRVHRTDEENLDSVQLNILLNLKNKYYLIFLK